MEECSTIDVPGLPARLRPHPGGTTSRAAGSRACHPPTASHGAGLLATGLRVHLDSSGRHCALSEQDLTFQLRGRRTVSLVNRKRVVGLGVFALAAGAVSVWVLTASGENPRREALAGELSAAYPAERAADGDVREFDLTAAPTTVDLAEGVTVDVWAYEGTVPGPELRVALGDTVVVNLRNELPQATSIHWHGVRVPNAMDGVPGVNQEAVPPGDEFRYEFVPKDAGTFWFHSHNRGSEQVERGLYGSLVVIDPDEPEYDRDLVWVIDDWLLDQDGSLVESFNEPH
ncbi:MAG: multicopper oxidase domain-containing protein, partial [Acidimicrobiales bacterium]|nr:multicopper oxidase domain-containing protein [Acidimicrobiales bacterium]